MAKRTPARKKGPDLALITLGALALIVLVMFISGAKYLSDEPVENSNSCRARWTPRPLLGNRNRKWPRP
jgi:hypothetical protein